MHRGGAGLREEGITVLGVERPDATYLGSPTGKTCIHGGDTLVLYGSIEAIKELDRR